MNLHLAVIIGYVLTVALGTIYIYLLRRDIRAATTAAEARERTLSEVRAALDTTRMLLDDLTWAKEHSPQALRDLAAKLRDFDRMAKLVGPLSLADLARLPDDLLQQLALTAAQYVVDRRPARPAFVNLVDAKAQFLAGKMAEEKFDAVSAETSQIPSPSLEEQIVLAACGTSGVAAVALAGRKLVGEAQ